MGNIFDPEFDQIAAPQLAINGQIEKCRVSNTVVNLQTDADGSDLLQF